MDGPLVVAIAQIFNVFCPNPNPNPPQIGQGLAQFSFDLPKVITRVLKGHVIFQALVHNDEWQGRDFSWL
jgi:hypothetical protein